MANGAVTEPADLTPVLVFNSMMESSGEAEPLLPREDGGGFGGGAVGRLGFEVAILTGRLWRVSEAGAFASFLESKLSSLLEGFGGLVFVPELEPDSHIEDAV